MARLRRQAALLLAVMLVPAAGCHRPLPTVDMSDTVKTDPAPPAGDDRPPLRCAVGAMISPEATRHLYTDLLRLVAAGIGRRSRLVQRRTYAEVNALVGARLVDLAFVCSGPYISGRRQGAMELLAVPVVHGATTYRSHIIVGATSPVRSIDDLRGRSFVFTDPDSLTGFRFPVALLARRGTTPSAHFSRTWFTHAHDTSIRAVARGEADGAAVDSLVYAYVRDTEPGVVARTRIIARSRPFGIPPVVVRTGLDPALVRRLRAVFLSLHEDPSAAILLRRLHMDRFVEGDDRMYDTARELSGETEPLAPATGSRP